MDQGDTRTPKILVNLDTKYRLYFGASYKNDVTTAHLRSRGEVSISFMEC